MLHNLEYDLGQKNLLKSKIIDTLFSWTLVNAYKNWFDTPYNQNARGALQKLGTDLQNDESFGGMYHIGDNHWVTAVVEMRGEEQPQIVYGDPLGKKPNQDTVEALRWFLAQHALSIAQVIEDNFTSTEVIDLSCSPQVDGYSCGVEGKDGLLVNPLHKRCPDLLYKLQNHCLSSTSPMDTRFSRFSYYSELLLIL